MDEEKVFKIIKHIYYDILDKVSGYEEKFYILNTLYANILMQAKYQIMQNPNKSFLLNEFLKDITTEFIKSIQIFLNYNKEELVSYLKTVKLDNPLEADFLDEKISKLKKGKKDE
jgi:hypothetical protein